MPVVLVHGVPETPEVWDELRPLLGRDSVALSLPGFGTPLPEGATPTKEFYADWLAGALKELDGPIDLVGHDWGALLAARVATTGAVPLRSWAMDVACVYHPSYDWHELARIWQTPAAGEAFMEHALTTPADHPESTATAMRGWGVPEEHALAMHGRLDRTMCDAILSLYQSATPNVFADWGTTTAAPQCPGLVLVPEKDHVEIAELSEQTAELLGARSVVLPDLGHWWMLEDPEHSAWELTTFWDSLD
ncbi:alpha/beta fold hydrolase [Streptomyces sp. NPDC052415]|uniref:alpha/beta fold hydrolase n=1 Tax=Streptomyces sp. NPDC052415 TaxID=3365690 RepID=UPI0037D59024